MYRAFFVTSVPVMLSLCRKSVEVLRSRDRGSSIQVVCVWMPVIQRVKDNFVPFFNVEMKDTVME